jgi:PPOX class probable F420-dependent enzyme
MAALEGKARELLEAKNYAHIAVLRKDGTIQTAVVWIHVDDDGRPIVNSAEGRGWPKNLRREGRMTISVANSDNPYEYVSITGSLAGDTNEGADEVIDQLAKKYLDADSYPFRQEGEVRITFTIEPERVTVGGG